MWSNTFDMVEETFLNLSRPESIYSFSSQTNNEEFEITFDNYALKQHKNRLAAFSDILSLLRHFTVKNKATQQMIPIINETPPELLIRQFVSAVIESSGHYGQTNPNNGDSSYYSGQNVIGKPSFYPAFGDSSKTWCTADTTNPHYIIVKYETALSLHSIGIYETFTHNRVSSVSAYNYEKQDWEVLFKNSIEPDSFPPVEEDEESSSGHTSYIFRPFVLEKKDSFITDKIRIDISNYKQTSWYEVDAIEMLSYCPPHHFEQEKQKNICETWFKWFNFSTSSERGDMLLESKERKQFYVHSHILQIRCPVLLQLTDQKLSSIGLQFILYYIYSDGLYATASMEQINSSIHDVLEEIKLVQLPILYNMLQYYEPFALALVPLQTISYALSCRFERTLERDMKTLYNNTLTREHIYKPNVCIHFVSENEMQIWAHSSILMQHSEYFSALLKRWLSNEPIMQVELQDISSSIFALILKYMYIGQLEWSSENVLSIYMAAKQLIIPHLITSALENLATKFLEGNEWTLLRLAQEHDLADLQQICIVKLQKLLESYLAPISFAQFHNQSTNTHPLDTCFAYLKTQIQDKMDALHKFITDVGESTLTSNLDQFPLWFQYYLGLQIKKDQNLKCKCVEQLIGASTEYYSAVNDGTFNYSKMQLVGKPKRYIYCDNPKSWCPTQMHSTTKEWVLVKIKYPILVCNIFVFQNLGVGGLYKIQGMNSKHVTNRSNPRSCFNNPNSQNVVTIFEDPNAKVTTSVSPEKETPYFSTWQRQQCFYFPSKACDLFLLQFNTFQATSWLEVNGIIFIGYKQAASSEEDEELMEDEEEKSKKTCSMV